MLARFRWSRDTVARMAGDSNALEAIDPLAQFRLDGLVAIVTGASSGLGARAARVLDALGATVVVSARRTDRIEELAAELAHGDALTCDVSVPGASAALVEQVVERHGTVDVVFANAGITTTTPALREPIDRFAEVVAVDLVAPFELAQAAVAHMRTAKHGGSIVNVASAAAFTSTALLPQAGYVAAKTGLVGLTRELALQWGRYDVRVNALCPGMFPSEMTSALVDVEELRTEFEKSVVLHRVGRPHELDGAIAFLASSASSYMTGTTLLVDGGGHT
jgi:NAD(P)-dependent dehydrogenase (short-subunit alcohol dehydrogenase family)